MGDGVAVDCDTKQAKGGREKRVPGPGQGIGIESGDKDRSKVEDLSPQIHARVFEFGADL